MPRRTKKPVSKKTRASRGKLRDVKVPKKFQRLFAKAQTFVDEYFSDVKRDTSKGTLNISGERYLLVRAASMSVDFFDTVKRLYKDMGEGKALDVARSLLFDIAHAIGKADARNFSKKMKVKKPVERLSAGPVHFAHSGWAFVDILPESRPTPDENYYLIYDHPFSFESAAWLKAKKKISCPVCIMNAGYSSGWCEESFNMPLVAQEIMCKAAGDKACRFIMAPPSKIEAHIKRYVKKRPALAKRVGTYEVPGFFKRKQIEQELREARNNLEKCVNERTQELQEANEALKESERRFQQVAESAGEWIWEVDTTGRYTYSNRMVEKILGYTPEEIVGKLHFYDFFPPEMKDELKKMALDTFAKKTVFKNFVNTNVHKNGDHIILETSGLPIIDEQGKLLGYRGADMDITERIKAEEELKRAIKLKSDFMAMMSHELRTPLTRIISSTHLVLRDPDAVLSPKRVANLNNVLASSDNLLIMINNVLEMARLESGAVHVIVQECDLNHMIRSSIATCEGLVESRDLHFAIHIEDAVATVHTDKEKLGHILINLISNAVRYSDKGAIEIVASPSAKEECVDIAVTDEGMGIPHEKMPLLFKQFQQLEEVTKRRPGGIGLGLAIAKANLDFIGGTIDVKSEVGKGTTFTITIPVKLSEKSHEL